MCGLYAIFVAYAIVGADKAMPRGAWFIRPAKVTVVYGKPLNAEQRVLIQDAPEKEAAAMMQQLVEELYDSVETGKPST